MWICGPEVVYFFGPCSPELEKTDGTTRCAAIFRSSAFSARLTRALMAGASSLVFRHRVSSRQLPPVVVVDEPAAGKRGGRKNASGSTRAANYSFGAPPSPAGLGLALTKEPDGRFVVSALEPGGLAHLQVRRRW